MAIVSLISCLTWKAVMAHVLLKYHIKVKKSGEAFKVIPTILMHYNSGMLDSDLKRIEGQKESCMRTKIASMTCKSIAKWRTWRVLKSATNEELWGAFEKERGNGTPSILYDLVKWIKF